MMFASYHHMILYIFDHMQLSDGIILLCCRLQQLAHTMLWTDERLQQVIARYTPVLHLHEEERYLPCSVDWYIKRSQLWLEEPVEHVSYLLGHMFCFLQYAWLHCMLRSCSAVVFH